MKRIATLLLAAPLILASLSGAAQAKWWIFGRSSGEVAIRYLFINRMAFDQMDEKNSILKDSLSGGLLSITGKASSKGGKIGRAEVSVDGKTTWKDARLSDDGAFEFAFAPEAGKTYDITIRVSDTTGKTNDVDAARKQVTVVDKDVTATVREAMNKLTAAYQAQDVDGFMALVGEDFTGDASNLDRAVRNDFRALADISLSYALNNVSLDEKKLIHTSLTFNRTVTSRKTAKTLSDRGTTEFVFKLTDAGLKLYRMKLPLIFGLSDANAVAQGAVNTGDTHQVVVIDSQNNVATQSLPDAVKTAQSGGDGCSARAGALTLNYASAANFETFTFASETKATEANTANVQGDLTFICSFPDPLMLLKTGTRWLSLGSGSIDSVTTVPDQSTYNSAHHTPIATGLFALYTLSGKYAVIRVNNHTFAAQPGCEASLAQFDYRTQPNGTTSVCAP